MTQLISNEIDNAVRLRTLETLLTALDNCSDMVQITDHEDQIIFQNSVGERVLGYSSSDYSNGDRHLWDFQSTAAMYAHAVLEENDTAVRKVLFTKPFSIIFYLHVAIVRKITFLFLKVRKLISNILYVPLYNVL